MNNQEGKFVSGPWIAKHPNNDTNALDVYAGHVKVHHGQWGHKATAHLIAAAPDLFKKLDDVLSVLLDLDQDHLNRREEGEVCDAIKEIEAVLAKARGEL